MTSKLLALTAFFVVAASGIQMAKAQSVDFRCPRAGTIEVRQATDEVRQTTRHYMSGSGASKDDPYVCDRVDPDGKIHSVLFNYFGVDNQFKAEAAREAFMALLSGRQKSVTYEWVAASSRIQLRETWTLLRHETLTVDGKPIDTIVFSRRSHNVHNVWMGDYTLWLDPRNGLWLKSEYHLIAGQLHSTLGGNYQFASVTLPP